MPEGGVRDGVTYATPVSGFFTSYYDDVTQLDFFDFLYYFPGDGTLGEADQAEFDALAALPDFPYRDEVDTLGWDSPEDLPVPTHRIPRASVDEALLQLKLSPFEDIGYAKVDLHRKVRQGAAEVIYGAGKTAEQIAGIVEAMKKRGQQVILITRLDKEKAERTASLLGTPLSATPPNGAPLSKTLLHGPQNEVFRYFSDAQIGLCGEFPKKDGVGTIVVATGGTSDIPVAEEAALTAEALGNQVERLYDVGVAGLHRLMAHMDSIMSARVIIAIAGMEGALASVIGGLADCPVIAVPTSIGYGASFHGVSALLSMLNSCASGVSVVNIDNGFGAGYLASMINHLHDPAGAPKH